jgi:hypothetical protein
MWRLKSFSYWCIGLTLLLGWLRKDEAFVGVALTFIIAREKTQKAINEKTN